MMQHLKKILPFMLIIAFLLSCENDEECRKDKYVVFKAGFYKKTLNTQTNVYSTSALSVDSIWVHGIDNDSMLYKNKKNISSISLPLRKTENQTDFEIRFNNTTDTLTILHQDTLQYLSLECGCIKTFVVDTVITTNHFIDSVKISNHTVNTTDVEHIKIYH